MKHLKNIAEIDSYIDTEGEISRLKKELNAIIVAHYYQDAEIQDVADFVGNTLEISKEVSITSADYIIFCGVRFMAEAIYILNPNKKILVPDLNAGCSLVESCHAEDFKAFRSAHPEYLAITYINSSSEVKALSDIIVTAANAERIINSIPADQPILFSPDRHLGSYLTQRTGRPMKLWQGSCIVHENFSERDLIKIKTTHPKAKIIAHPACTANILEYAEHIGSTSSLLEFVKQHDGCEFIVLTEPGIIHQLYKASPNSKFYDIPTLNKAGHSNCSECAYMRLNSLEKLYLCMLNQLPQITVDPEITKNAKMALDRMFELSKI